MPENTPYIVEREGKRHMVEASSPAKAVLHVVRDLGVTVKPATGRELSAFHRSGEKMEVAGGTPEPVVHAPEGEIGDAVRTVVYADNASFHDAVMSQMADEARADRIEAETDAHKLQHGKANDIPEDGTGKVVRRKAKPDVAAD